jgi:hypothetical protein
MKNIPKILHLYWDLSPMSELQTFTVTTFHRLNPDWQINVYVPMQHYAGCKTYVPDYIGKDYFPLIERMPFVSVIAINLELYGINLGLHDILRSDIFRYKILYDKGGVWSDFDVIWLKPMSYMGKIQSFGNVSIDDMDACVCMYKTTEPHHNISIMISRPGSEFIKSLIDETDKLQAAMPDELDHQLFGTNMLDRLYPTLHSITSRFNDVVGLKYETFYPYSIFDMNRLWLRSDLSVINDNVMCVHWFNGHRLSKDYINDHSPILDCSMRAILKRENLI